MREIVLDTETTGLDPERGDRIVEVGCLELMNHLPTGRSYQTFVNPERVMSEGAANITGITDEQLVDKPLFAEIAEDLIEFLGTAPLVIHNAVFDVKFLNAEFSRLSLPLIDMGRTIDTVQIARRKYPRAPASLDALCRRFEIDLDVREKHGALVDAELLAKVYLELIGGRQPGLVLASEEEAADGNTHGRVRPAQRRLKPLEPLLTDEEAEAHAAFVAKELGPDALWTQILAED